MGDLEVAPGDRELWIQFQCSLESSCGLIEHATAVEHDTEVVLRPSVVRVDAAGERQEALAIGVGERAHGWQWAGRFGM